MCLTLERIPLYYINLFPKNHYICVILYFIKKYIHQYYKRHNITKQGNRQCNNLLCGRAFLCVTKPHFLIMAKFFFMSTPTLDILNKIIQLFILKIKL